MRSLWSLINRLPTTKSRVRLIAWVSGFPQVLAADIAQRSAEMPLRVKLMACDGPSGGPAYNLLVFSDRLRYLDVKEADVSALIEDHLTKGGFATWKSLHLQDR